MAAQFANLVDLNAEALERELDLLAHQRGGFDRPEAIAAKVDLLLRLESVVATSGSGADSRTGRVFGLRAVLATAIQRLPREATRTSARIYFFLDEGGEHEEDLRVAKLEDRRLAIESRLGIAPDTYRKGEEQRVRALVAGELLRHEESARREPIAFEQVRAGQLAEPAGEVLPTAQAMASILSARYRPDQEVSLLTSLLLPDRPIYYETLIEIALIDAEDPNRYYYQLKLTYSADVHEYVVGIVGEPALSEVVLSSCGTVTDVYSCSSDDDRDALAEKLAGSLDAVRLVDRGSGGQTRHRPLRLSPTTPAETSDYLGDWAGAYSERIKLLRTDVPPRPDGLARLVISQEFELSKQDHFCYWVADRPTFVRNLSVDLNRFRPLEPAKEERITVYPFMMAGAAESVSRPASLYSLAVENWLVRGQGIAVVW